MFSLLTFKTNRPSSFKSLARNEPKWTSAAEAPFKQWAAYWRYSYANHFPGNSGFLFEIRRFSANLTSGSYSVTPKILKMTYRHNVFVWDQRSSASGSALCHFYFQQNVERELSTSRIFTLYDSCVDFNVVEIKCGASGQQTCCHKQ